MARKEERKEWEKALHGLHSVALNEWPHYSNDNNFAGIRFCMRRGVALKGIRLTIKDKEYSPEVVDADLHYWWLCNNNHFEVALALIQSRSFAIDARISFKGFFDTTPLIYSCYRGNVDCVNALLDQGADANKSNKSGWTALHIASQEGELPCLQGLLRAGATVDRQTDKGWTALMYAVKEGHESCVRALLAAGASRVRPDGGAGAHRLHAAGGRTPTGHHPVRRNRSTTPLWKRRRKRRLLRLSTSGGAI